jgi:hypothetical protein
VLDTFDTLQPAFDNPQSLRTIRRWLEDAGLEAAEAGYGWNGIEARGRTPRARRGAAAVPAGRG